MDMEDRGELLKGLYTVRHYLQEIYEVYLERPNFGPDLLEEEPCVSYQPRYQAYVDDTQAHFRRVGVRNLPDIILMTVAMALGIVYLFQSLISGNFVDTLLIGAAIVLLYQTIGGWSPLRLLSMAILIYATVCTVSMVSNMVRSGYPFILVLYLVFFAVAAVICALVVVARNRKIDAKNEVVDQHNQEVAEKNRRIAAYNKAEKEKERQAAQINQEIARRNAQIKQDNERRLAHYRSRVQVWEKEQRRRIRSLTEELLELTASWYPRDYYSMYAVDHFLALVENFRADTVKEMVNLFETDEYHRNMLQKQSELGDLLQETQETIRTINRNLERNRSSMKQCFAQLAENQERMRQDIYYANLSQLDAMSDIERAIREQSYINLRMHGNSDPSLEVMCYKWDKM